MKLKAYSSVDDVSNDLRRLSKEIAKASKSYSHSKSALACAKLEVTAGLQKQVSDRLFWNCFDYSKDLHKFDAILSNIELSLYHHFGDTRDFDSVHKQLAGVRKRLSDNVSSLSSTIVELASRKVPKPFKRTIETVKSRLTKLPCQASASEFQFFPANKGMYFVSYLNFTGVSDKNGYINPNLYVAVAKYYGDGPSEVRVAISRGKRVPPEMHEVDAGDLMSAVVKGLSSIGVELEEAK